MHSKLKTLCAVTAAAAAVLFAGGCGGSQSAQSGSSGVAAEISGSVSASGSSALFPLVKDAAGKFKEKNPKTTVEINAGGSGVGLKQVSDGTVEIGDSDVFAEEKLPPDKAKELVDHKVCIVTMAPVVNKDIGAAVKSLTKQQLADIFTAKVTNWKDVGGPDEAIVLVTRPQSSGTRAIFKKYALGGAEEVYGQSLETDDSGVLLQNVIQNKGAIGYVALPYLIGNKDVASVAVDGVEPTLENTYSGKYPVWGYEHMYTKGDPKGAVAAFLAYMMSPEYGAMMEKQGYGISDKMKVSRTAND